MRDSGLTLIEVLVSLAILTLIATTTLPLLREAGAVLGDRPLANQPSIAELGRFADVVTDDPKSFSFADVVPDEGELDWPEHEDRGRVTFRRVRREEEKPDHDWVLFQWSGLAVWRWQPIQATELSESESR